MLNFITQWWDLIWSMWQSLVAIGGGGLFGLVMWILATILAFALGIVAPLIAIAAIAAFIFVVGVKVGVFLIFVLLISGIHTALTKGNEEAALRMIQKDHPSLSVEQSKDLLSQRKEFDRVYQAHVDLWKEEMDARRRVEKNPTKTVNRLSDVGVIVEIEETQRSRLINGRWVWKESRELKNPSSLVRP